MFWDQVENQTLPPEVIRGMIPVYTLGIVGGAFLIKDKVQLGFKNLGKKIFRSKNNEDLSSRVTEKQVLLHLNTPFNTWLID